MKIMMISLVLMFVSVLSQASELRCENIYQNPMMNPFVLPEENNIVSILSAYGKSDLVDKFGDQTPLQLSPHQIDILNKFLAVSGMDSDGLALQWRNVLRISGELLYLKPDEGKKQMRWERDKVVDVAVRFFEILSKSSVGSKDATAFALRVYNTVKATAIPEIVMLENNTYHRFITPNWAQTLEIMSICQRKMVSLEQLKEKFAAFLFKYDFSNKNLAKMSESQQQRIFYHLFILSLAS